MISNVRRHPFSENHPMDGQSPVKEENLLTLSEMCSELSICVATGRNWLKLGKIIPTKKINHTVYFSREYVSEIKSNISSGKIDALKSRRNKKFVTGNFVYKSYVSKSSKNLTTVKSILEVFQKKGLSIDRNILIHLIANCAQQLILSRFNTEKEYNCYKFLIDDLLDDAPFNAFADKDYPEFSNFRFIYESGEDTLGLLYISLNDIGERKATGLYYTPPSVVKKLCCSLFDQYTLKNKNILDPCCGTGNFILQLPSSINGLNVYGNDIDPLSVKIARINYALKYQISDKNVIYSHITESDYILGDSYGKFDYIIGNPPWGYEYTKEEQEKLRERYLCASGSRTESFDVFIEQSISNLSDNGHLSFVLPEAILNVKLHTQIREIIMQKCSIKNIEFLGNVFYGVQCPCIILDLEYTRTPLTTLGMKISFDTDSFIINTERKITSHNFNFATPDSEYLVLNKIRDIEDASYLLGNADFALGIVTGNNKKFISNIKNNNNEMVLKGADLRKYYYVPTTNYITFDPHNFQQTAPLEMYRAKEKILYRFVGKQLVFAYDDKQTLSLNSCNIVIPKIPGLKIKYVLAILNSRIAQFIYKSEFNSLKVLRSHIESIPIPSVSDEKQAEIIALTDELIDGLGKETVEIVYDELDMMIANIYNLDSRDMEIIKAVVDGENKYLS